MKYLPWLAVAILAFLVGMQCGPTEVVTETITLPGQTITDTVTVSKLDSVEVVRFRDRVEYRDIVLKDTVWITLTDTIAALAPRWRLTALQAGQSVTEPTFVSGDLLAFDGALTQAQTFEQYPVTLGAIQDIRTSADGIHIAFGTWPQPPKPCAFWCRAQYALGGFAAGVITWEVAR